MKSTLQPALRHGPEILDRGVVHRLWSPRAKGVTVIIGDDGQSPRRVTLEPRADGWFEGFDEQGSAGDLYQFLLDDQKVPDVASRFQPRGVKGPSQVVDARKFSWPANDWKRPALEELVIYELHVGTFTEAGSFAAAIERLKHVKQLGANAIQLMPVGAFPGDRNWGYDVVLPFAPADAYGQPDDLRQLVAAAHQHGLAVIMDVVYNHVCGEPNILQATAPDYFKKQGSNPWGSSLNFDGEHSAAVRAFFLQNAIYWIDEFHMDGLRLDATHAIVDKSPVHLLQEITEAVHQRGGLVIAEDDRNKAKLLLPVTKGGLGLDAAWADDFHHVMKMMLKPEPIGHFRSYQGTSGELVDTVENGWLFRGQNFLQWNKPRGTECRGLAPAQFVYCISNHDQAGNRPVGERLNHLISAEAYRAASMFFLLLPYTPMLFMGQEWAAETPFVFFTNHEGTFGPLVSEGRRKEFEHFGSQWPSAMLAAMPDPEKPEAFSSSKLNWSECAKPQHAEVLALYRECLRLRAQDPILRRRDRAHWKIWTEEGCVLLQYGGENSAARLVVSRLTATAESTSTRVPASIGTQWMTLLSSNEKRFGGKESISNSPGVRDFRAPQTILLGRNS